MIRKATRGDGWLKGVQAKLTILTIRKALILAPVFVLAVASTVSPTETNASVEPGIDVTVYDNFGYDGSPPLPSVSGRPAVGTTTVNQINQDFDSEPMFGVYEDFIVKYEGYITSPVTGDVTFYPYADDGTKFFLDGVLIDDNWVDKGGGGNATFPQSFVAGVSKPFTYWYYENGGGANTQLFWDTGEGFEMVPASSFTKSAIPTTTTTTTIAPYLNQPQNLTATANPDGSVNLDWDAPEASNVDIYAYGVMFYNLDEIGGTTSGGWGVWTNQGTNYSLADYMFSGTTGFGPVRFGIKAGNQSCFSAEGVGPCIYGPEINTDVVVADPTMSTTTTTSTTTTSTSTTSTTEPVQIPTNEPVQTEPINPNPVTETTVETSPITSYPESDGPVASVPQYAPEQETTTQTEEPSIVVPEVVQDAADVAVADIFDGPMSNAGLANAVDDLVADAETPEQLTAVVNSLLDQELTDTQFTTVVNSVFDEPMSNENFSAAVDAVFADTSALSDEQFDTAVQAVFDGPLSTEQFGDALEAVFSEPLSDEKFDAIIDAVLDEPLTDEQFEEVVGILESDAVSEEQVSAAVDSILENEVTADQATELATSEKVLESIDGDQAAEIFDAVEVGELTSAEEAALVAAVTDAPEEVKSAFEETIDVFGEGLDDYVPVGSAIDVATRRSVIAVTSVLSTIGAAGVPSGASNSGPTNGSSGGSSGGGGSGGSPSDSNKAARREDEPEDEEAGGLEGPEDREKNTNTKNSIYTYGENNMKKFSIKGFVKKLMKETAALSFTFAGSAIMFVTLSGDTRRIAIIATLAAVSVHYIYVMLENDSE